MNPDEARATWEQFLTPEVTRGKLVTASLYITAYEVLKDSVIGRVRSFYVMAFDESHRDEDEATYQAEVLALDKKHRHWHASLQWLLNHEAISNNDLQAAERLTLLRNDLAHRLPSYVIGGENYNVNEKFQELLELLRKVEVWWIVNVELPCNPAFDGQEIDIDNISPGPILIMQMMLDVIAGKDDLLNHWRQQAASRPHTE